MLIKYQPKAKLTSGDSCKSSPDTTHIIPYNELLAQNSDEFEKNVLNTTPFSR